MVSRVDPDTWLSTAEFFRASLPEDQLPGGRGGPDGLARYYREAHPPAQGVREPAWLARRAIRRRTGPGNQQNMGGQGTIDMWDSGDTQPGHSPQIVIGRQPLPPSVDATAVCKTRRRNIEHRAWATYAEIRALNAVRQYYIDHPNEFRHIPVPRVYTHSLQQPEDRLVYDRRERGFIIMEHIKDNGTLLVSFPRGDEGWTRRQKRRFVRKMALIRLQLLFIRNNQNGVEPPIQGRVGVSVIEKNKEAPLTEEQGLLSTTTNEKAAGAGGNTTFWEAGFNPPYPNNRAWVHAHLSREYTYWQAVINNNLHSLLPQPMPIGFNQANWFENFRTLQTALQNPAVHTFRTEPFHALTHDKLSPPDDSILMKGKKINCIVDWERSGYLPISENIKDILKQYEGAGLADPEIWTDDEEPFSKCRFYGRSWDDWIENMRLNRWQAQSIWTADHVRNTAPEDQIAFEDRFNWYGRITPNDFRYGDKYADQDIEEDDGNASCTRFRISAPITRVEDVGYDFDEGRIVTAEPDLEWWSGPVMHLVNDYVQTHLGYYPAWSWPDPVIEDWGRRYTNLGEHLDLP
ncbi:hypothetical protein HOY80DRAFT_1004070 [Tuber brumale]|nr:hypothetical protein HOY80DRAFT_1004070 [Tuber brumale]